MKKWIIGLFCGFLAVNISAQDLHFSQFGASPSLLNPAMTGFVPCTYRFAMNYRSQYGAYSQPVPFTSYSLAFDGILWKPRLEGGGLGLGAIIFNDRGGEAGYSNFTALFGLSYHQKLGGKENYLSMGFQGGYVQKSLDYTALKFEDMIQSLGFNLPTSEIVDPAFDYFDLHAGIHWRSQFSESFGIQAGGAYFHVPEPTESWLSQANTIDPRFVAHGGFRIGFGNKAILLPSAMYQTQAGATESLYGAKLGFRIRKDSYDPTFLYLGAYYRSDGSIASMVAMDWKQFQFGVSYDVPSGEIERAANSGGAFEIAISYNGCVYVVKDILQCPRAF